jgi:hypothetical protein
LTALLRELLTGDTREENYYRQHTRECNAAMAFASAGAEIKSLREMAHTLSGYTARFTIWSHCYVQTVKGEVFPVFN